MGTAQFGNMPSELKGFVVGHAVNAWRFQELPCVLIGDRHIEHLHLLSLRQRRSDEQDQEKLPTICAFLYCAAGGQPDCMRSSAGGAAFCYVES